MPFRWTLSTVLNLVFSFITAKRRLPQSYTPLDDKKIVNFICKNNYYKEANSPKNRMWQRVAKVT